MTFVTKILWGLPHIVDILFFDDPTNSTSPDGSKRYDHVVRAGMLRETIEVANYSLITHLLITLALTFLYWGHASNSYLVTLNLLIGMLVVSSLATTIRCRGLLDGDIGEAMLRRGISIAKAVALLIGVVWSTMPMMLIPLHDKGYQLVAVATTAGLISDAYVVGPFIVVSRVLILPIVAGAFYGLSFCEHPFGMYLMVLLSVYAGFVLLSTRRMSILSYQRLLDRVVVLNQSDTIGLLLNEYEEGASDWLWEADAEGRLTHAPARMAALIGVDAPRLRNALLSDVLTGGDDARSEGDGVAKIEVAFRERRPIHDHVFRLRVAEGYRWWKLNGRPCHDARGQFTGYRGVGSDITAEREAEDRIVYLASHDALTGLYNRGAFQGAIEDACASASRPSAPTPTAFLYVDLDGFKNVNDGNSHSVGDRLLKVVAGRLAEVCGSEAVAYRIGGDEFAVLRRGGTVEDGERLAASVVRKMRHPFEVGDLHLTIGASVGLAFAPDDAGEASSLLSRADLALYDAKAAGKNCWRRFAPAMEQVVSLRRQLDIRMRGALLEDQFELHYQPQVEILGERIVAVEALLRWHTPDRGWISPAEVVSVAETSGFIQEIGRWVLHRACRDALAWPKLSVAVNISSKHFRHPTFFAQVESVLDRTGFGPERLEIEITESILLDGGHDVLDNIKRLRRLGIRLALDDFGTGYSSLGYLTRFTFDKLKIDRSLITNLQTRPEALAILKAIDGMAKALGIAVTVEGVENAQQIEILRQNFEGLVQGFHYSRAVTPLALTRLLAEFQDRRVASMPRPGIYPVADERGHDHRPGDQGEGGARHHAPTPRVATVS